ncbi:MAG: 50S ribosomal protein L17 [Chitinophagaceae bacterium]|nr:50S ribosomal protein L17 [Chitinophagaceae bacterium]
MRHGDKVKNLGRKKAHRDALLSNLACQLIQYKRIVTTTAKAKALRVYVEPLITKGKENTTHQRRIVFSYLQDKEAIKELFGAVAEKVAGRPGGYTRVIKLGARVGDNAETAMIELVDFNEIYGKGKGEAKGAAKKTRRAGGAKIKVADAGQQAASAKSKDDLKKIEGIGEKAEKALHASGISTYADLAKSSPEELKTLLDMGKGQFNAIETTTWPEQAALAAAGKWDELKEWQDKLIGGKEA